jgi:P-type Ca2+ transporter type 2C
MKRSSVEPRSQSGMQDPTAWHTLTVEQAFQAVESGPAGLSEGEVAARRARVGANVLADAKPIRMSAILARQFRSLLVGLLVVAGLVAGLLGEWLDASAILAIVVLNALIGFFQEWRAEQSIAALRRLTAPQAKVRRGGVISIPAADVVPGDVVLLEAGDLVPADLRLLEASALRCSEASLTGESEPVDKSTDRLPRADLPLGDRVNLAYMGTSIAAGAGAGVVFATAMNTELGRIARLLSDASVAETQTPLEQRLSRFGRVLVWACLGIVVVLFGLGVIRGLPTGQLLLVSISLAVAAVPEGLPAVATVALALGVARMARRRALVRRLAAVETLGSANVICTDKTGTLTVGAMTARSLFTGGTQLAITGEGYGPEGQLLHDGAAAGPQARALAHELLFSLVGCCDASLGQEPGGEWRVVGDPTEGAILAAGAKLGLTRDDVEAKSPRLREWPFDATRKRMSVARCLPDGTVRVLVKGAPEVLLDRSRRIWTHEGARELTAADREQISRQQAQMSGQALRVLAAAWRDVDGADAIASAADDAIERELVFAGLLGMYDPPRPEARQAVSLCHEAGIRVVMITGDHPRTALAIAREIGIAEHETQVLAGTELAALSDDALASRVDTLRVCARVTAEDKVRIVRAWQARGAVVGMTGDGVNDAPAIRAADIGISMGRTGTEVTKQASDMIITDDDFASIVSAIAQGRGIFDNIRKALLYLLAGNAGELLLMAACIVLGLPVPLLPVHLLWINLVTDGLPALCLANDSIGPDVMRRPPRDRATSFTDRSFVIGVGATGVLTAGTAFGVYLYGLIYEGEVAARTHAFSTLVFAELLRAFGARSETLPLWRIGILSNARLVAVVGLSFALQIVSHHVGAVQQVLETGPVSWTECAVLVGIAALPMALLEAIKLRQHRPQAWGAPSGGSA